MQPRRDPIPGLQELQATFAHNLRPKETDAANDETPREPAVADADPPWGAGIEVYRNNAWQFFRAALERTYAVTQRRVGAEFFRQLAHEYRARHPSRHGDLHWIGEAFPAWLAGRLAGTGYQWLADLARLEWACEEAAIAATAEPVGVESLSRFDEVAVPALTLVLHPSLRLVASPFPIWSVWQSNQADGAAVPVDLDAGAEHCAIACVVDRVAVYRLHPVDHRVLQHLLDGLSLERAITTASANADTLGRLLGWMFAEGLVVQVVSPSAPV